MDDDSGTERMMVEASQGSGVYERGVVSKVEGKGQCSRAVPVRVARESLRYFNIWHS